MGQVVTETKTGGSALGTEPPTMTKKSQTHHAGPVMVFPDLSRFLSQSTNPVKCLLLFRPMRSVSTTRAARLSLVVVVVICCRREWSDRRTDPTRFEWRDDDQEQCNRRASPSIKYDWKIPLPDGRTKKNKQSVGPGRQEVLVKMKQEEAMVDDNVLGSVTASQTRRPHRRYIPP